MQAGSGELFRRARIGRDDSYVILPSDEIADPVCGYRAPGISDETDFQSVKPLVPAWKPRAEQVSPPRARRRASDTRSCKALRPQRIPPSPCRLRPSAVKSNP